MTLLPRDGTQDRTCALYPLSHIPGSPTRSFISLPDVFIFVYLGVLFIYVRESDPMEPELQTVVSCHVRAGN